MDAAKLQARIYSGYAKAARRIGRPYDIYRPTTGTKPLADINKQHMVLASFNAEDFSYGRPNKYGKPTWYGLFDGRQTKVGDYLVGESTYFIAAQQDLLPILCIECNRTINVFRPQQDVGVGALGYSGDTVANEQSIMVAWPASVLQGTKGERNPTGLPGDVRSPWWAILLPAIPGVQLKNADIITDDLKHRYAVSSAELTDLGWRLTAMQVQA